MACDRTGYIHSVETKHRNIRIDTVRRSVHTSPVHSGSRNGGKGALQDAAVYSNDSRTRIYEHQKETRRSASGKSGSAVFQRRPLTAGHAKICRIIRIIKTPAAGKAAGVFCCKNTPPVRTVALRVCEGVMHLSGSMDQR